MKLVVCQGSPVLQRKMIGSLSRDAEFFLEIDFGTCYVRGCDSEVICMRWGRVIEHTRHPLPLLPASGLRKFAMLPFVYWRLFRLTMSTLARFSESRDSVYVGRSWLCALFGLWARMKGSVRRVVYWIGDFFPCTGCLETRLQNAFFQIFDRLAVRRADETWFLTRRIRQVHADKSGRTGARAERIVPGVLDAYPDVHFLWSPSDIHRLVFLGYVQKSQGIEVILCAIERLLPEFPSLFLEIVGGGPDVEELRATARALSLSERVCFRGYVEDETEVNRLVARSAAGFALYDAVVGGHARYTVTSKVYRYIGCGVPVIITKSAGSFEYVMNAGAGVAAEYNPESVADGIRHVCSSVERCERYRAAARKLAGTFEQDAAALKQAIAENCAMCEK